MSTTRRSGFAVAAAVFALVVIAALVTGGLIVARHSFRSGLAGPQAVSSLYAAEAGLNAALAGWSPETADAMSPGTRVSLGSGVLTTGDEYSVWLTRLDAGQDARTRYYLLSASGRARGVGGGHRQVALVLRTRLSSVAEIREPDLLTEVRGSAGGVCSVGHSAPAFELPTDDATLVRRGVGALGALALHSEGQTSMLEDGAALVYSSCAVARASRASQLHMPHPLAERAWFEIFR